MILNGFISQFSSNVTSENGKRLCDSKSTLSVLDSRDISENVASHIKLIAIKLHKQSNLTPNLTEFTDRITIS